MILNWRTVSPNYIRYMQAWDFVFVNTHGAFNPWLEEQGGYVQNFVQMEIPWTFTTVPIPDDPVQVFLPFLEDEGGNIDTYRQQQKVPWYALAYTDDEIWVNYFPTLDEDLPYVTRVQAVPPPSYPRQHIGIEEDGTQLTNFFLDEFYLPPSYAQQRQAPMVFYAALPVGFTLDDQIASITYGPPGLFGGWVYGPGMYDGNAFAPGLQGVGYISTRG